MTEEKLLAQLAANEEWLGQIERSLAESEKKVRLHFERAQEFERSLAEIQSSASFRIANRFAGVCRRMAPPGTLRRSGLNSCFRALKLAPRLRDRRWVAQNAARLWDESRGAARLLVAASRLEGTRFVGFERAGLRRLPDLPRFPRLDRVDVSIIIPVFNQWRHTYACLESIARVTTGPSFEVIVIDDGSSDLTPELFERSRRPGRGPERAKPRFHWLVQPRRERGAWWLSCLPQQ